MPGFELNKIAASLLIAALIAMIAGNITDILYKPELNIEKRGYQIEIAEQNLIEASDAQEVQIKIGQLMAEADANKGKENSHKCSICHNFEKNSPAKVGPSLWDVVGEKKGKMDGYQFSKALLGKGGEWTYEDLYHFLNSPKKFVPGTKMGFAGLKNPQDIVDTIAYLRSLSDNPKPLPVPEQ